MWQSLRKLTQLPRKFFRKKPVPFSVPKTELRKFIPEDATILEAGTCDGTDTEEFAKVFPKGHIYGFECMPNYFSQATARLQSYRNVSIYPFALNDKPGTLDFYVSTQQNEVTGSGSILRPKLHKELHPSIRFDETIKVEAITIDDWAERNGIKSIDFMWLDLQGAELKALHGAPRILKTVRGIFMEVSLIETYENVPLYDQVKTYLNNLGFQVEREFLPYRDMGNVLFIRP